MSYGFEKAKKSAPAAESGEKKLDITGLDLPAPIVTAEQEAAVVAKGDALGFGSREAKLTSDVAHSGIARSQAQAPIVRSPVRVRRAIPTKSVLVKGPQQVLDRFVLYTNESGANAYWEALDQLLKSSGK
jgi:hypothetical protein